MQVATLHSRRCGLQRGKFLGKLHETRLIPWTHLTQRMLRQPPLTKGVKDDRHAIHF